MGLMSANAITEGTMHLPSAAAPLATAASSEASVSVRNLCKRYPGVVAVDDVSFDVLRGEIFGVLGPNGAGKTTLIEILEGLRLRDEGTALIFGHDVAHLPRAVRFRLGAAMQVGSFPPLLTVQEFLGLCSEIYGARRNPSELLTRFELQDKRSTQIRQLSGGQRQRLAVAAALAGNPDLLFLDEPTSQMDPHGRRALWDVLGEDSAARSVVLTTHLMSEAQRLCTRVAIVDHGRILALDTPDALIEKHCPFKTIVFSTDNPAAIRGLDGAEVTADKRGGYRVSVRTNDLLRRMTDVLSLSKAKDFAVRELRVEVGTLEDVFLSLTGRAEALR